MLESLINAKIQESTETEKVDLLHLNPQMLVAAVEDMLDITVVGNTDTIIQSNRKSLNSTLQLKRFCGRKYC